MSHDSKFRVADHPSEKRTDKTLLEGTMWWEKIKNGLIKLLYLSHHGLITISLFSYHSIL